MVSGKVTPYLQMNYIYANITKAPSMNMIIIPILSNIWRAANWMLILQKLIRYAICNNSIFLIFVECSTSVRA